MARWLLVAPVLLATLSTACQRPPEDSAVSDTEQRLAGPWLRDYEQDGVHVRRVLVLEPGGGFRELSRGDSTGPASALHSHAGEWSFDGTNLKRRYTSVDGKPPAAPTLPYATFELRFQSRNEFVGIDHVRKRQVLYRRVDEGTLP